MRPTRGKVREDIEAAFRALERASERSVRTQEYFERAYQHALEEEWRHRNGGRGFDRRPYRQSSETAAQYFVVTRFIEPPKIASALDAASIGRAAVYSAALRQLIEPDAPLTLACALAATYDYREDLAQPELKKGGA